MDPYLILGILINVFLFSSLLSSFVSMYKIEKKGDKAKERWEKEYWKLRKYVREVHGVEGIQLSWLPRGKVAEDEL